MSQSLSFSDGLYFRRLRDINNTIWSDSYPGHKIQKVHPSTFRVMCEMLFHDDADIYSNSFGVSGAVIRT